MTISMSVRSNFTWKENDMGVYNPKKKMPTSCYMCWDSLYCEYKIKNPVKMAQGRADDCTLIEIAEPTETLKHDIRKLIAFIEPRMIIASTYDEQIERAEAVKDWLLSIVGERKTDVNRKAETDMR